ncbi:MAG TPA: CoA transferase subunit A [Dehalococcoidia bacterium]|nr:CoA transferase subunit A [Dehalococcoidia bacterium]
MRDKVVTAAEALAEVRDGALVAFNFWGPGTPLHLMRALQERGVKDLTICTNNYTLRADVLREQGAVDAAILLPQTRKIIVAFSGVQQEDSSASVEIARRVQEGTLEIENVSHGLFIERLHAGAMHLGGIYSPIGIGTSLENGKEKRVINGVEYLFQEPIVPDLGLINAAKADTLGNLVCHGTARAANPVIAMASRYTVAEVFEVVEPGGLDPDTIVIPASFVDRIVRIPDDDPYSRERRVEQTLRSVKYRLEKMAEAEAEAAQGGGA